MSVTIKLDEYSAEDVKAIQLMKEIGFSDAEIQQKYNRQKTLDEQMKEQTNEHTN